MHAITGLVCCALEDRWRSVDTSKSTSSILLLLCVSKPHLVQGQSTRLANHMRVWTHMCKNGGNHYFTYVHPVVISNSMKVLEYWHKYPTLKLSSISHSSTLILVH